MAKKVLFVLTSHDQLVSGKPTGFWLSEVSHPYYVFKDSNYEITMVTPKGGKSPMDAKSKDDDPENLKFLADEEAQKQINNTLTPDQVSAKDFDVVFFPGGHGPMFDLVSCPATQKLAAEVYEKGGIVGAVCHGPASLINVQLSDGSYLLKGKKVTAFSNAEEAAVGLVEEVEFSLEDALKQKGAVYECSENWKEKVVVDGRLASGQNPASARALATAIVNLLK